MADLPSLTYPFAAAPLRYAYDALEPAIDAETMRLHHGKHHQTYVANLNALLKDQPALHGKTIEAILRDLNAVPETIRQAVRNQGGGHANHQFFWKILGRGEGDQPSGPLLDAMNETFGGIENFKARFKDAALAHFGAGWTFLVIDKPPHGPLEIVSLPNQDSVLSIGKAGLLCCDLWEHAYYLKHQNRKAEWLDVFWDVVAWDVVRRRFDGVRAGAAQL